MKYSIELTFVFNDTLEDMASVKKQNKIATGFRKASSLASSLKEKSRMSLIGNVQLGNMYNELNPRNL